MLSSYSKNNGVATINIVMISGVGVTIAAIIKIITVAYLLLDLINFGVINPSLERIKMIIGSSKIMPVPKVKVETDDKYESTVKVFLISALTV